MPQHADTPGPIPFQGGVRHGACVKVIGAGGGRNNAINRMIDLGLEGVEFISVDTDFQSLRSSRAALRLQLGTRLTHGLGTGTKVEIGRRAALDEIDKIVEALEGADMVFITAGLGGGTGTAVAPVIASAASRMGALTVAIVTLPFAFEGKRRMKQAERGLQELLDHVDTLIVIPNDRLLSTAKDIGFFESFQVADDVLRQAVQGISEIIAIRGVINRDFADVRTTMAAMGYGVMGAASRSGPHRAREAALAAISSPLFATGTVEGARGILINISGSNSLKLSEVHEASTIIERAAHEDANIIFGAVLDERLGGEIKITVIATGFHQESRDRAQRRSLARDAVERPPNTSVKQTQIPLDRSIPGSGPTARHLEREPTKSPMPEITAELPCAVDLLPLPPLDPAAKSNNLGQVGHMSPESSSTQEALVSPTDSERKPLDASPQMVAPVPYEEDLLACIEGLPFDLNLEAHAVASSPQPDSLLETEITRVRQAAMAAYAELYPREIEGTESGAREAASFAEILESRRQMHALDEDESEHLPDEEDVPHQGLDALPPIAQRPKAEPESELDIPRLHIPPAEGTLEPPLGPHVSHSSFVDGVPAAYPTAASVSAETPTSPFVRSERPTPDFNRRLNREPDYSMGVEVI